MHIRGPQQTNLPPKGLVDRRQFEAHSGTADTVSQGLYDAVRRSALTHRSMVRSLFSTCPDKAVSLDQGGGPQVVIGGRKKTFEFQGC